MKKTVSILLALLLLLSLAPTLRTEASAAQATRSAQPWTALSSVVYVGNPGICRMTPQQAQAYAAKLEELKHEERPYYDTGELSALLLDIGKDGVPLLLTMNVDWNYPEVAGNTRLWEYLDGVCVSRDFTADWQNADGVEGTFYAYHVAKTQNGSDYFVAISDGGGGVNPYSGHLYYTASQGALTLAHRVTYHNYDPNTGKYFHEVYVDGQLFTGTDEMVIQDRFGITDYRYLVGSGSDAWLETEVTSGNDMIAALHAYAAAAAVAVEINGKAVQWTDVVPYIDANDRTMVPLRAVGEALGLTVSWNGETREAGFSDGSKTLYFPIGSRVAHTSDGSTVPMDTAAVIVNDRTYAPIRYLAQFFGCAVDWDGNSRTVLLSR